MNIIVKRFTSTYNFRSGVCYMIKHSIINRDYKYDQTLPAHHTNVERETEQCTT